MDIGFDGLLNFLTDKIVLQGSKGATFSNIKPWASEFYSKQQTGDAAQNGDSPATLNVDDKLCNTIWKWLLARQDVQKSEKKVKVSSRSVASPSSNEQTQAGVEEYSPTIDQARPDDNQHIQYDRQTVLTVPEERVWHALTGHGVDFAKVPQLQFNLLLIIAQYGKEGVAQPELRRISDQDKRSVPKRTDILRDNGYIEKKHVIWRSGHTSTSVCTLKKFAEKENDTPIDWKSLGSNELKAELYGQDGLIKMSKALDYLLTITRDRDVVPWEEIRESVGVVAQVWHRNTLLRLINKAEHLGVIKMGTLNIKTYKGRELSQRVIQYKREPTKKEWEDFGRVRLVEQPDTQPDGDIDNFNDPVNVSDLNMLHADEFNVVDKADTAGSGLWRPDVPLQNLLFDVVQQAGPAGINSNEILNVVGLKFYRRPTEAFWDRLTDNWKTSQPVHHRHLTLVRDVTLTGRNRQYFYRSLPNLEVAVERGETSWEAVGGRIEASTYQPDEWGFPPLQKQDFIRPKSWDETVEIEPYEPLNLHQGRTESGDMSDRIGDRDTAPIGLSNLPLPVASTPAKKARGRPLKQSRASDASVAAEKNLSSASGATIGEQQTDVIGRQQKSPEQAKPRNLSFPASSIERPAFSALHDEITNPASREKDVEVLSSGVHIDPPTRSIARLGRPRKFTKLAVFRHDRLYEFDWFKAPTRSAKSTKKASINKQTVTDKPRVNGVREPIAARDNAALSEGKHLEGDRETRIVPNVTSPVSRDRSEDVSMSGETNTEGMSNHMDETMDTTLDVPGNSTIKGKAGEPNPQTTLPTGSQTGANPPGYTIQDMVGSMPVFHETRLDRAAFAPVPTDDTGDAEMEDVGITSVPKDAEGLNTNVTARAEGSGDLSAVTSPRSTVAKKKARRSYRRKPINEGYFTQEREENILEIIRLCDGVYPGARELHWAYMSHVPGEKAPDPSTITRSVDKLVEAGKLNKYPFSVLRFTARSSQKTPILALPHIAESDEVVENCKKQILNHYPDSYFPPGVKLTPEDAVRAGKRSKPSAAQIESNKYRDQRWSKVLATKYRGVDDVDIPEYLVEPGWMRLCNEEVERQQVARIEREEEKSKSEDEKSMHFTMQLEVYSHRPSAVREKEKREKLAQIVTFDQIADPEATTDDHTASSPSKKAALRTTGSLTRKRQKKAADNVAQRVAFTQPSQDYHSSTGTFGTQYALQVPKKVAFDLSLDTAAPARFEAQFPADLSDIIRQQAQGRDTFSSFSVQDVYAQIDQTEQWELENEQLLTQGKELPQARFINYTGGHTPQNIYNVLDDPEIQSLRDGAPAQSAQDFFAKVEHMQKVELQYIGVFLLTNLSTSRSVHYINHVVPLDASNWSTTSATDSAQLSKEARDAMFDELSAKLAAETAGPKYDPKKPRRLQRASQKKDLAPSRGDDSDPARYPSQGKTQTQILREIRNDLAKNLTKDDRLARDGLPFTEQQIVEFIEVVVPIQMFIGGEGCRIDWYQVNENLPATCKRIDIQDGWKKISQNRKAQVAAFRKEFGRKYLHFAEVGAAPEIDYSHAGATDWQDVVAFAHNLVKDWRDQRHQWGTRKPRRTSSDEEDEEELNVTITDLPTTREMFAQLYEMRPEPEAVDPAAIFDRKPTEQAQRQLQGEFPTYVAKNSKKPSNSELQVQAAMTVARAQTLTPSYELKKERIKEMVERFDEGVVTRAIETMRRERVLVPVSWDRRADGGPMLRVNPSGLNKALLKSSLPKSSEPYQKAIKFKKWLDRQISSRPGAKIKIEAFNQEDSGDPKNMVVVALSDAGYIHLDVKFPPVSLDSFADQRTMPIFGSRKEEGRTQKIHQAEYVYSSVITPTEDYVHGLLPLTDLSWDPPTCEDITKELGGIPMWIDINGKPLKDVWITIVVSIVNTLCDRPGLSVWQLAGAFGKASSLQPWELCKACEWLADRSVLCELEGHCFEASEWWWCLFGESGWDLPRGGFRWT